MTLKNAGLVLIFKAIKQSTYRGVSNAKIALIDEKIKHYTNDCVFLKANEMFCWDFIMVN